MKKNSAPRCPLRRSARVSTVYVAPPRVRSTSLTSNLGSLAATVWHMASLSLPDARGAGFKGWALAGTSKILSSPRAWCTWDAAARCPTWMGSNDPPRTPMRDTSVTRTDAPEGEGHKQQCHEAGEDQEADSRSRDRQFVHNMLGLGQHCGHHRGSFRWWVKYSTLRGAQPRTWPSPYAIHVVVVSS